MNVNNEGGKRRPLSRQAETVQQTQRYQLQGTYKQLILLEHRVYWEMVRTHWRSEEHLIGLAEESGFNSKCN